VLVTAARWRFLLNVKGYGSGGGPRRGALGQCDFESIKIVMEQGNSKKQDEASMHRGDSSGASVGSWQVRNAGYATAVLSRRCRRRGSASQTGQLRTTTRTARSEAEATDTLREVVAESALGRRPNQALQRIAARWRM
jgi:hypothetical protein